MIDPNKAGLVLGSLNGGCNLLWAALVAAGWAQPLADFMFRTHFIKPVYTVTAFDPTTAALLVVGTGAIGYLVGCGGGALWNRIHRG